MAYTAEEWHAWVPSTKEASPKAQTQKARLEFARAHADKDEDYWDSILWSDETKIMFLELMASKLYGVAKVRNTKKNAWCLQ